MPPDLPEDGRAGRGTTEPGGEQHELARAAVPPVGGCDHARDDRREDERNYEREEPLSGGPGDGREHERDPGRLRDPEQQDRGKVPECHSSDVRSRHASSYFTSQHVPTPRGGRPRVVETQAALTAVDRPRSPRAAVVEGAKSDPTTIALVPLRRSARCERTTAPSGIVRAGVTMASSSRRVRCRSGPAAGSAASGRPRAVPFE